VLGADSGTAGFADDLDAGRADAVLPVVRLLLGLDGEQRGATATDNDTDDQLTTATT
jgi:hypothetical protein